jgi:hypothetical protein
MLETFLPSSKLLKLYVVRNDLFDPCKILIMLPRSRKRDASETAVDGHIIYIKRKEKKNT